ncbi:MAG: flagellar biosynthetic protein FliO [Woeseiaceae bacterium]
MLREILNTGIVTAATDVKPSLPGTPGVDGGDILGLGVSMFIVVAVIMVLGWLYSRTRFVGGGNADVINVVATRALGPKERLLVVEVADQQLLVGMTATGVQTLHVFDKPVCVAEPADNTAGFADRLRSAFQEIGK